MDVWGMGVGGVDLLIFCASRVCVRWGIWYRVV